MKRERTVAIMIAQEEQIINELLNPCPVRHNPLIINKNNMANIAVSNKKKVNLFFLFILK